MSPIAAIRSRRTTDLPQAPTDEELLAWSQSLLTPDATARPRRTEPLRAASRRN